MNSHLRPGRPNGTYYQGIVSTSPACERCPLRHKRKVMPDGPVPARIAFVGEEPGRNEEMKGQAFVGPSGALMWDALGPQIGLRREDVWVTNAALCRSDSVRLDTGAVLPKEQVQEIAARCCRRRLIDELRVVDPVVIVPLGRVALRSLLGLHSASIYAYRGACMEVDLHATAEQIIKDQLG